MTDWRKPCEHGRYESHFINLEIFGVDDRDPDPVVCPGGSPISTADLDAARSIALPILEGDEGEMFWEIKDAIGATFIEKMGWGESKSFEALTVHAMAEYQARAVLAVLLDGTVQAGAMSEQVWWCSLTKRTYKRKTRHDICAEFHRRRKCGWRLLIPIPDSQPATP